MLALASLLLFVATTPAQERVRADIAARSPLVAHIHVALADDVNQGISAVKGNLGDGMRPSVNLYWGALYGVRSFLPRAGWKKLSVTKNPSDGILERAVFVRRISGTRAYVVADAWAGPRIGSAIEAFTTHAGGHDVQVIDGLRAGGAAHVVAYLGHNGLMELAAPAVNARAEGAKANAAIVLACVSRASFAPLVEQAGAEPLLMTRSLMAPEAYTIDAALRTWFEKGGVHETYLAGAAAYAKYQKIAGSTARRVFWAPTLDVTR